MTEFVGSPFGGIPHAAGGIGTVGEWGAAAVKTLTAGGVLALTGKGYYTVDTFGGAAAQNCVQITGLAEGEEVWLAPANVVHVVTFVDGANLVLQGVNFSMDAVDDMFHAMGKSASAAKELGRVDNS